jgi:hypothetical protein
MAQGREAGPLKKIVRTLVSDDAAIAQVAYSPIVSVPPHDFRAEAPLQTVVTGEPP